MIISLALGALAIVDPAPENPRRDEVVFLLVLMATFAIWSIVDAVLLILFQPREGRSSPPVGRPNEDPSNPG